MQAFHRLTAGALPLPIDNLDTDQIMPKQFLRGLDKAGLGRGCLYDLRFLPSGEPRPESIFSRRGFDAAEIIVGGPNFGCGSSREHAVWGLLQMGVRCVIAPSFGEIFYSNCFNNGLLAAKTDPENVERLFALLSTETPDKLTVDLEARRITGPDGFECTFNVSERHRTMLLEGLDPIEATLRDLDLIRAFREKREAAEPWTAGLPGRVKARLES